MCAEITSGKNMECAEITSGKNMECVLRLLVGRIWSVC